ncbi:MAG: alkaline phosphatase PhoX [bacterium]
MTLRTLLLAATALTSLTTAAHADALSFAAVPFAADDAAKRAVLGTASATMNGAEVPLAYHTILRTGDTLGDQVFGALLGKDGKPIGDVSSNPDFTSLLPVGDKLFSLSHFENNPAALYLTELAQDAAGNLTAVSTKAVDLSDVGGIWDPCAGSVTPWGTHLGSEEYPDDARGFETAKELADLGEDATPFARYYGLDPATMTVDAFKAVFNPYRYGHATEITVTGAGEATVVKHYGMGRISMELAYVMPDQKTAYVTNDGTNVALYRFVADTAGDLSAGQLYALKWLQTSADNGGAATVEWIDLGHADDAAVKVAVDAGVKFSDLFETADMTDGACPEGFMASNAEGRLECLKVRPGMEMLASRLETTRYASMMGASTEFRKMEGLTYDLATNRAYVAITEIAKGMTDADAKADLPGRNDVRLAKNGCGAVYEMQLDAGYVGTDIKAVVVGMPADYAADAPEMGNACDVNGIASPDNVSFITGQNTLLIGEDSGEGHQNDVVWAVDLASGAMTRILSTPYGAEATSVDWYPNVGGHGYLMAVVQHPYGETDQDKLKTADEANAYVGYIGPFPVQ